MFNPLLIKYLTHSPFIIMQKPDEFVIVISCLQGLINPKLMTLVFSVTVIVGLIRET